MSKSSSMEGRVIGNRDRMNSEKNYSAILVEQDLRYIAPDRSP